MASYRIVPLVLSIRAEIKRLAPNDRIGVRGAVRRKVASF